MTTLLCRPLLHFELVSRYFFSSDNFRHALKHKGSFNGKINEKGKKDAFNVNQINLMIFMYPF